MGFMVHREQTQEKCLAIALYILPHNISIQETCEHFQHSSLSFSTYFSFSLDGLVDLAKKYYEAK